ncbi:MAG: NAD(P)/FAD-dependent oxidoreductase [Pseudomonadales bacterium]|nr:NAD(P)/FAD-dependent oxidoreductase [Pseudomonadales bacterium]
MADIDCIVIGAGAVGLAIARQLSTRCEVAVLERNAHIGMEISSRNSGVIHAGLYYPASFLKTRLCLQGQHLLYSYCQKHNIPHQRCGKLIVACNKEEIPALHKLQAKAQSLNINTQLLNSAELQAKAPAVKAQAALYSPDTGIIDTAAFMQQLEKDIHDNGSQVLTNHTVTKIDASGHDFIVHFDVNNQSLQIRCKKLINACGLQAQFISQQLLASPAPVTPERYLCKGQYFAYTGKHQSKHLIYPLPNANHTGLGIHLTLNIDGCIKFGPDAHYIEAKEKLDYAVNIADKAHFFKAIRRYLPEISIDDLQADYSGIRPKLTGPNQTAADFIIAGPLEHGINNLIQCFGIESPGLTASLAIGEYVETLLWP